MEPPNKQISYQVQKKEIVISYQLCIFRHCRHMAIQIASNFVLPHVNSYVVSVFGVIPIDTPLYFTLPFQTLFLFPHSE